MKQNIWAKIQIPIVWLLFITINFFISFIATITVPYLGFYSYPELLNRWDLPWFIERFAGFDGLHYIKIATEGYEQNATAFLPVFPLLIRLGIFVTGFSPVTIGIVVSIMSLLVTLYTLPKYLLLLHVKRQQIIWFLLLFLAFPTSFFLQGVYTESVFIAFLILALYMSKRKLYLFAALFGYFAGLSRITGFFLCVPFFFELIADIAYKKNAYLYFSAILKSLKITKILYLISPLLGFGTFMAYLWLATGDPLRLAHSQVDFNQNRSINMVLPPQVVWRYLKIFVTAQWNFQYFIAVVEFTFTSGVIFLLGYDAWNIYRKKYRHLATRMGLNIFAWLSVLLPMSTGTLLSMPRFILPLFTVFLVLSELPKKWMKLFILILFILFHTILLMAFIQGYFVS